MNPQENSSSSKSIKESERKTKLLIALACILFSAIAVAPFFFMGRPEPGEAQQAGTFELNMPTTHDMFLHFDQMKSFHKGLSAGEIYPRWEEETNHGFGAPTTSYYPPGVYYITSLFYALTGEWLRALLDAQLLMMIASAAALYFYCRRCMSRSSSFLAMTAYIFLPYHLLDQYQRGAIAELLSFVWMPLMLMFGEQLMGLPQNRARGEQTSSTGWKSHLTAICGLGLAYGLFLWSHPPTAYQFSLSFALFIGLLAIMRKEWKGVLRVGLGIIVGCALSAAYMLPAAVEQELIRHEYVSESWPYHNTYVFVHDLYNKELHREFFARVDGIWMLGAILIVIAGLALLARKYQVPLAQSPLRQRVIAWVSVGLFATFMMTKYSAPIGRHIPRIDIGVFTWRMLGITTVAMSLLAGACIEFAKLSLDRPRNERVAIGALGVLVALGGIAFSVAWVAWPMAQAPYFVPEEQHTNYAIIPRTAPEDPDDLPDNVPEAELDSETGSLKVEEWQPQHRVINVDVEDEDTLLIRTFFFPGWQATVDGNPVPITVGEDIGEIEINLTAGQHKVQLDFVNTPIRKTGRVVTLASAGLIVLGFAGGLIGSNKPAKKSEDVQSSETAD